MINGKVAQILNDREVIVNRGSTHGVKVGMYIGIIDPLSLDVVDPDTGESIGGIRRIKVTLKITQVSERLAVASTFKTQRVNTGGSGLGGLGATSRLFEPPKYEERVERLGFDSASARPLDESQSKVQVGDPFEQMSETRAVAGTKVTTD